MVTLAKHDAWQAGENYETYMGRWSSSIAVNFLQWLNVAAAKDWLDIGCGTGALSRAILSNAAPNSVYGIEPSEGFVTHARALTNDERASFKVGNAEQLPLDDDSVDVTASGLVLNFVPNKSKAIREMQRVTRPGGMVSFYVWDYPNGGVEFIDLFWKCAAEMDANASDLDESKRFPFCTDKGLQHICEEGGLKDARIASLSIDTPFATFDNFLHPFTLGVGPAPGYFSTLDGEQKKELTSMLASRLGPNVLADLKARAWSVKAKA